MWDPNPGTVSRVLLYLAFRFQILVLSPVQSVAISILLVVATWDPNPDVCCFFLLVPKTQNNQLLGQKAAP